MYILYQSDIRMAYYIYAYVIIVIDRELGIGFFYFNFLDIIHIHIFFLLFPVLNSQLQFISSLAPHIPLRLSLIFKHNNNNIPYPSHKIRKNCA